MPPKRTLAALAGAIALPLIAWAQDPKAPAPPPQTPAASGAPLSATPPAAEKEKEKAPPTEAEQALDEAIAKLKAVESLSADVEQSVRMLDQRFKVSGQYLRAPGYRTYLLLEVSGLGDVKGTMLQVCDGETMWEYKRVLEQPSLSKRTMAPILELLARPEADPELREQVLMRLGFPGPDALLAGLRAACEFNQKEEKALNGKKVWVIRGRWKDTSRLTSPDQPPIPNNVGLPPYVPSLVYVWLGQEDGWPYQVELSGRALTMMEMQKDTRELDASGRPIGRKAPQSRADPTEIVLRFSQVALGETPGNERFFFQPPSDPNLRIVDETAQITNELTTFLSQRAAQRKAEAAKEGGGDLPKAIDVPTPPVDFAPPPAGGGAVAPPMPR